MRITTKAMLFIVVLLLAVQGNAAVSKSKWVALDADSKNRLMRIVRSEVESREGYSTLDEDRLNTRLVEEERQKEMSAYKASIRAANSEFVRTKKRRDDLMTQFQTASYDFEELKKSYDNIKASIDNIDNQIARYQKDIDAQRKSLTTWLKTEKHGEAIVAVIYTRGFKDSAHELESQADKASAPLMASYMGTYVQSFTKVIDNVLTEDFIKTIEEGTAEWNRENPYRVVLKKETSGTTYLRIKRYELYPFQAPKAGQAAAGGSGFSPKKARVIASKEDLDGFLSGNGYKPDKVDLGRVEAMIRETAAANRQAEEGLREQLISYRERINYLDKKIAAAQADKEFQVPRLTQKKQQMDKAHTELEVLRLKKDSAVMSFQSAQNQLYDKKRVHESIIVKSSLVTAKRSQTPAQACAEAVIEELEEVLNDAKLQHSSSTIEVENNAVVGASSTQTVTDAKIIAVRLLSFVNEGDSVRTKMAFRVRTVLDEKQAEAPAGAGALQAPQPKAQPPASTTPVQTDPAAAQTPSAAPDIAANAIAIGEYQDVLFQLNKVEAKGNEVTFFVLATNKAEYTQYLAMYDETVGYTLSEMVDQSGDVQTVDQVYLWRGEIRTPANEAYRGVPFETGQSIVVEMIFRDISPNIETIPEFKLYPYVATRSWIGSYSWYSEYLPFQNVRIR
ncbi:MAG: hypothetical protein LJE94_15225 [Deltaproteobacteria bacterium]|nr:hypothetical protein [Deltaproteobacteria bacterium]